MLASSEIGVEVGSVVAKATSGRGLSCEELAEAAVAQILHIGDTVPQPLRDQAIAYRARVKKVIYNHLLQAVKSDRTTLSNTLHNAGFSDAAYIIGRL
jgi:hypothetical protein|tara:strand:+ start:957 stop:1250 length:294 start_codon:yes stop_codon:yes gene_type:complete